MRRVADYIMERLAAEQVSHMFLVTGRGALFLTDALAKEARIKSVCMHHEQAAGYAAVAYAQAKEKLGACLISTGCASTNAITPVLSAWQDGIPCLFISGQNTLSETSRYTGVPVRTYGQQEADIISVVSPITKYAVMLTDPKHVVYELEKAIYLATSGRKGPVWLDVPLDVQNMRIDPEKLYQTNSFYPVHEEIVFYPLQEDIDYLVDKLNHAKRPVFLIGNGVRASDAISEFEALIARYQIPVVYAASAPDAYGLTHPLSIGSVGMMGCSRAGNFSIQNSDLVVVLGHRLSSMTTGGDCQKFARSAKVVVVDIDRMEHTKKGIMIDRLIVSDIKKIVLKLMESDIQASYAEWAVKCAHWKNIFPKCEERHKNTPKINLYHLAECLSQVMPENVALLCDSGLIELILPTNIVFKKMQRCIHPVSQGAMGFALPAIMGAHAAHLGPVFAVIGDGSIMMNLQELETIRYHKIPVKIVVVNNNVYAVIRKRQEDLFRQRTIGTDPANGVSCPDFKKVAETFGLSYMRIDHADEMPQRLQDMFLQENAVLCEIIGDENQDYIANAYAKTTEKRFVQRPLEDQAPFLDRELFLSEMIIEPIDQ